MKKSFFFLHFMFSTYRYNFLIDKFNGPLCKTLWLLMPKEILYNKETKLILYPLKLHANILKLLSVLTWRTVPFRAACVSCSNSHGISRNHELQTKMPFDFLSSINYRNCKPRTLINRRRQCNAHASTCWYSSQFIDGLMQDCTNSIANVLQLLPSCTKPSARTDR